MMMENSLRQLFFPKLFSRRAKELLGYTLLVHAAIFLFAFAVFEYQRDSIQEAEFAQLNDLSAKVLQRSERSSDEVRAAIRQLEALSGPPCSAQRIALMAQINLESGQIQGVGYVHNDRLMCSSYGDHGEGILLPAVLSSSMSGGRITQQREAELVLSEGAKPASVYIFTIGDSGYSALVYPGLPIDVFPEAQSQAFGTVVYSSNQVRMTYGTWLPAWRARLGEASQVSFIEQDRIVSLRRSQKYDYLAFASHSAQAMNTQIHHLALRIILAVVFIVLTALMVWLFIRLNTREVAMSESIREGIRKEEFYLTYQPVVNMVTGKWAGAEALLRWKRPTGEHVRPDIFISIAEESDLIQEVTDHVFALAAADLTGFFSDHPAFYVAFNLSARDVESEEIVARVQRFVSSVAGAAGAHNFVFEVTERSMINPQKASRILGRLQAMGHAVAIDDFGTGYSSLAYLQGLGADILKIDKSFVDAIDTSSVKNLVVSHMIELSRDLHMRTIAEGVETEEQAAYLRSQGVEYGQGWLYARAMPFTELRDTLEQQGTADKMPQKNADTTCHLAGT